MHLLAQLIKETLPNYLSSLPIPDTLGGWFRLGYESHVNDYNQGKSYSAFFLYRTKHLNAPQKLWLSQFSIKNCFFFFFLLMGCVHRTIYPAYTYIDLVYELSVYFNTFLKYFVVGICWVGSVVNDWLSLIPPTAVAAGVGYMSYLAFCPVAGSGCSRSKSKAINSHILKQSDKVVDSVDVEDIAEQAAFCRCWRTKNWPYCDGSHNAHNKEEGDNVGPLIIKKK